MKIPRKKSVQKEENKMGKRFERYSSNHSSENNRRKTVGVTIKPDLLAHARDMKINLSKLLENTLIHITEANEGPNSQFLNECSFVKENSMVDGAGFEPAASAMPTLRSFQADLPAQLTF